MTSIHLVSRQIGTAYPFVEFYKLLTKNGFKVKNFIYASSIAPFQAADITYEIISSFDDYLKIKGEDSAKVIMTGTSLEVLDDSKYWNYATQKNIASVAWADQPINLAERFLAGRPDIILSNDKHTLEHLLNIGLVKNAFCFGSPYLDMLSKKIKRNNTTQKTFFFASEPYFENRLDYLVREKSPERLKYGFDDVDALLYALSIIEKYKLQTGNQWRVLIRPHPCDNISHLNQAIARAGGNPDLLGYTSLSKEEILEVAPVVMGMRSMFLFEAASLGIPTISLQPGQKISWPFMDSHSTIVSLCGELSDFTKFSHTLDHLSDRPQQASFDAKKILEFFSKLGAKCEA